MCRESSWISYRSINIFIYVGLLCVAQSKHSQTSCAGAMLLPFGSYDDLYVSTLAWKTLHPSSTGNLEILERHDGEAWIRDVFPPQSSSQLYDDIIPSMALSMRNML